MQNIKMGLLSHLGEAHHRTADRNLLRETAAGLSDRSRAVELLLRCLDDVHQEHVHDFQSFRELASVVPRQEDVRRSTARSVVFLRCSSASLDL